MLLIGMAFPIFPARVLVRALVEWRNSCSNPSGVRLVSSFFAAGFSVMVFCDSVLGWTIEKLRYHIRIEYLQLLICCFHMASFASWFVMKIGFLRFVFLCSLFNFGIGSLE